MRLDSQLSKYYYTNAEARKRLGLDEQAFQYWVRKERIKKITLPGRTQGVFSKKEVDEMAQQITATILAEEKDKIEFRRATVNDLEQEYELAHLVFGEKAEAREERKAFLEKNSDIDYHLYDEDRLVAYINVVPLKHKAIEDFIHGRVKAWEIKVPDIEQFKPGKPLECLIIDMVTTPTVPPLKRTTYGSKLLTGLLRTLSNMGSQGIEITKVYAASETPTGIRILKNAGFETIYEARKGRLSFELDIMVSDAHVLREYKEIIQQQKMKEYYTAEEAMKILELPTNTLDYLANKGEIPKTALPLIKEAVYPKEQIDKIARERARTLAEIEAKGEKLTFTVPSRNDLKQLIEIEKTAYHEQTIIPVEQIERRMSYNPENIHVLKEFPSDTVLGSITMSPLKEGTLQRLINLEIDETQIELEDYRPYTPGIPLDCYVVSIIAKPIITEKYYAGKLMLETINFLTGLLERGVTIKRIYTVATTQEGDKLVKKLHFTPIKTEWSGDNEEFRHSYVLDLENGENKGKLIELFMRHKRNLENQHRRYNKSSRKTDRPKKIKGAV